MARRSALGDAASQARGRAVPEPLRVPPRRAVRRRVVAKRGQICARELAVSELGLLQAQDVRTGQGHPLENAGDPGRQGVDVPGGESQLWRIWRRPKNAPWGSFTTANRPPGKSCGAIISCPPLPVALVNAWSTSWTLK